MRNWMQSERRTAVLMGWSLDEDEAVESAGHTRNRVAKPQIQTRRAGGTQPYRPVQPSVVLPLVLRHLYTQGC